GRGGAAVVLLEQPADMLHVPGRRRVRRRGAMRWRDVDLLGQRLLILLLGDELLDTHAPEHVVLACLGRLQPLLWVVLGRALRQPGQERRLRDREVLDVDVEERARRGLDAVRAGAEIDLVQVEVQDVVLTELVLETHPTDDLLPLAPTPPTT